MGCNVYGELRCLYEVDIYIQNFYIGELIKLPQFLYELWNIQPFFSESFNFKLL